LIDVEGEEALTAALVKNTETGEEERIELSAIFASIGTEPRTQLFKDSLTLDDFGYIVTDEGMRTSLPGVFAAGDVRQKAVRQITTAVADGTIAALNAEKYIRQGI
jgi:thioredoxin reductase (NADPH)